ncbi:MAG: UDP-N-acetylglucosamine 2-epimerase (hydrolyzing) [Candidatus Rokubacteria bacterium]|nr:UDP-N-acetylglucosamine 2-epimerase (hydrolyzing) [Candidatus Rokubacteria bacterium]
MKCVDAVLAVSAYARRRIGVVSVARSDYGHLVPVLTEIRARTDLDLLLFLGGAHLSDRFGRTERLVEADGWPVAARIATLGDDDGPVGIAQAVARGVAGFAEAFARQRPDILVVFGDRYEMASAALAALPLTIPVAHIHGGELSEGAIDDSLRHAITKLAHLHFASTDVYGRRICQLGEEAWRVHVTGAPGLDRFSTLPFVSRDALATRLGITLEGSTIVVTFHPVTLAYEDTAWHADELLGALAGLDATIVITYPGADTASSAVIERLEMFAARTPRVRLVRALGDEVYVSLLREADAMVGNSSSGLIEAPTFGLPVVNIGTRQRGRVRGANVIDVDYDRAAIAGGIRRALDPTFAKRLRGMPNPYGDGHAAPRIVDVLSSARLGPELIRKRFADTPAGGD